MQFSTHHINARKRNAKETKKEMAPYPHPSRWGRFLDNLLVAIAIVGPAATIPQIISIFSSHSAGEVSLFSWLVYTILDVPWIVYGFVHKEVPIITAYTLWFLVNGAVVVGVLIYGH